jgi:nicotinamidase-related amidase
LVIDPYNDFISEGGKVWDRLKSVAEANGCVPHMLQVLTAARKAGLRVFYALHRRYRPGDYETWKYIAPVQKAAGFTRRSNTAHRVARSAANSSLNRANSWP